jgi:FkbM family methyltransferase
MRSQVGRSTTGSSGAMASKTVGGNTKSSSWMNVNATTITIFFLCLVGAQQMTWSHYYYVAISQHDSSSNNKNATASLLRRMPAVDQDNQELLVDESTTSESDKNKNVIAFPPMSCTDMLEDRKKPRYLNSDESLVQDVNQGIGYFRLTVDYLQPQFWVSLHDQKVDAVRWCIMTYGKYYEDMLSQAINTTLNEYSPSEAMFLDVGGNIGWFSLLARALGYEVAVFEPNPVNQLRLCESLLMNNWLSTSSSARAPSVQVYPYGVGDEHGIELKLKQTSAHNPGAATFTNVSRTIRKDKTHTRDQVLQLVSLDEMAIQNGWISRETGERLPNAKTIAFMKVDVEGFEVNVFKGAQRLLKSGLVQNVEIEWNGGYHVGVDNPDYTNDPIHWLTKDGMFELYRRGSYRGPSPNTPVPQTNDQLIPELTKAYSHKAGNLWFRYVL